MKKTITAISALALASATWAANLASDDASDPAYSGGWTNGSNGGTGFGAWQLLTVGTMSGHFIGDSTKNADGADDGNVNGKAKDNDINTFTGSGQPVAWGMYASEIGFGSATNSATAIRPFTGGPLNSGQTFSIDFDNGYVNGKVGQIRLSLLDGNFNPVFSIFFIGGPSNYGYSDAFGSANTTIDYGDEGLRLEVTMTGPTNYLAKLTRFDGQSQTWTGSMSAAPEAFQAQTIWAGSGPSFDLFINSMAIVPEPSTITLGALGTLGVALRAFRRRLS
jgi:hypothetical protein